MTGISAWYPVHLFLKNDRGEMLGGLLGQAWGGWLYISYLWVDEAVRGKGWATQLMDQAEAYARERGCHSVELDTHSFQARPFYERRGYEVFGQLEDFLIGILFSHVTKSSAACRSSPARAPCWRDLR